MPSIRAGSAGADWAGSFGFTFPPYLLEVTMFYFGPTGMSIASRQGLACAAQIQDRPRSQRQARVAAVGFRVSLPISGRSGMPAKC